MVSQGLIQLEEQNKSMEHSEEQITGDSDTTDMGE